MLKDKIKVIGNFILKHSKIAFPLVVIAAVAVTVSVALNLKNQDELAQKRLEMEPVEEVQVDETPEPEGTENVYMELDTGSPIRTLICTLYNALALGEEDTMQRVLRGIDKVDILYNMEMSKYIESYPVVEVYTKPGYDKDSTIAFVYYKLVFKDHEEQFPGFKGYYICTDEQGELYINEGEVSEDVATYIDQMASQDDVVEFYNRVDVEYKELLMAHPELLEYYSEMNEQVKVAVGLALADANATEEQGNEVTTGEAQDETNDEGQTTTEQPVENVVQYATATTTVNVRSSDSEQADKVNKVPGGSRVQVLEQKVNGWSKIKFEGKEGYIKSEYLELAESAVGLQSIGTVTATTNVNVRPAPNQSADRIGVLADGDTVDLYAVENGWCKIKYNGNIGYVKADYVE